MCVGRDRLEPVRAQQRLQPARGEVHAVARHVEVEPPRRRDPACSESSWARPTSNEPAGPQPAAHPAPAPRPGRRGARARATAPRRRGPSPVLLDPPREPPRPAASASAALRSDGSMPCASNPRRRSSSTNRPVPGARVEYPRAAGEARAAQHPRRLADRRALQRRARAGARAAARARRRPAVRLRAGRLPSVTALPHVTQRRAVQAGVRRLARGHLEPRRERPAAGGAARRAHRLPSRFATRRACPRTVCASEISGFQPVAAASRSAEPRISGASCGRSRPGRSRGARPAASARRRTARSARRRSIERPLQTL